MVNPTIAGALASQELRDIIQQGWFGFEYTDDIERRIQPASYDPILSENAFRVPALWKPDKGATILESLRRLPSRRRAQVDLSDGGLIIPNRDFSWLVFLEGEYTIPDNFWLRASPKSTEGRLGNWVQLVADKQTDYDEVNGPYKGKLAVKITPRVFSSIIYPGMPVNQLRVFCGQDFNFDERSLRREVYTNELLYEGDTPVDPQRVNTRRGLEVHLDLEGRMTDGLVGFRAIGNPDPLDRRQRRAYPIHHYFDAIEAPRNGLLNIDPTDTLFVLATLERIRVPIMMAAEMDAVALEHGWVKWHEAGFFDPGFGYGADGEIKGKSGVVEVHAGGRGGEQLKHGQGCGRLQYHPLRRRPDKWYGMEGLGSSYADQIGAWFANPFVLPGHDLAELARLLLKQKEPVMAIATEHLFAQSQMDYFQGFKSRDSMSYEQRILQHYEFEPKESVEWDTLRKQPIPYVLVVNPTSKRVLVYKRAVDDETYTERRLQGKISIGIGGHVRKKDLSADNPLLCARDREFNEEIETRGPARMKHLGYINYDGDDVSRVHFGILYAAFVDTDDVRPKSAEVHSAEMMTLDDYHTLAEKPEYEVEAWTKIAIEQVEKLFK
ncbi:hypothetical protein GF342_04815 [Candidatus Woesearchaeota archaeon]|nr:hypothetical protein [Candidatus Woesearchaeota archaeon]